MYLGAIRLTRQYAQSYRKMLDEALVQNFPELGEHLMGTSLQTAAGTQGVKMEEDATAGPSGHVNGLPNGV